MNAATLVVILAAEALFLFGIGYVLSLLIELLARFFSNRIRSGHPAQLALFWNCLASLQWIMMLGLLYAGQQLVRPLPAPMPMPEMLFRSFLAAWATIGAFLALGVLLTIPQIVFRLLTRAISKRQS